MKANNALIFLWNGNTVSEYLVGKLMEILIANGIAYKEDIVVQLKDEDSIVNALLRDSNANNDGNLIIKTVDENSVAEAVKQSIIYIGKRFEASLKGTNGNLALFALELNNACISARNTISFGGINSGTEILKAVEILATTNAIIPPSLAKKYHFTQNVVEVIKKVYQQINK